MVRRFIALVIVNYNRRPLSVAAEETCCMLQIHQDNGSMAFGLSVSLVTLTTFLLAATAAVEEMEANINAMRARVAKAVTVAQQACNSLMASLACSLASLVPTARARVLRFDEKCLAEHIEEAHTDSLLLDSAAGFFDFALLHPGGFGADHLSQVALLDNIVSEFCFKPHDPSDLMLLTLGSVLSCVSNFMRTWSDCVDPSLSEVTGQGVRSFVAVDASSNSISIIPRVCTGEIAAYVCADDVRVQICPPGSLALVGCARVSISALGHIDITYEVKDASVEDIFVNIFVCEISLCRFSCRRQQFSLRKATLQLSPSVQIPTSALAFGVLVSLDGRFLVISYVNDRMLRVFEILDTLDELELVNTIGGSDSARFSNPFRMCNVGNNFLVCDSGTSRVYEFSTPGYEVPELQRSFDVMRPFSVAAALQRDLVAVGTGGRLLQGASCCGIQLLCYSSGSTIRSIDLGWDLTSQLNNYCCGISFSSDGKFIAGVSQSSDRISLFNVDTGTEAVSKELGAGILKNGWKDIILLPNGNYMVSNVVTNTLFMFDSEAVLIRSWCLRDPLPATESPSVTSATTSSKAGTPGSSLSTLNPLGPRAGALAVMVPFVHRHGKLEVFVLDTRTSRVQVFI